MNKDKVYLKGYVVGHAADTLGYKGLLVKLENLDVVEIDKNLVHKDINEPRLLKLKDVIKRIEKFDLATKAVWINEILNKLGSDYGIHKYYAGYKQGKFDGAIEHEKVTVPQFVADYIEYAKEVGWDLLQAMKNVPYEDNAEFRKWFYKGGNVEVFTRAQLDGCEVEQEKRYLVKVNAENCSTKYLVFGEITGSWLFAHDKYGNVIIKHTRKELEEAGFGWVFDCPGIEIEEVKE